jgi:hypothetical protein
MGQFKSSRPLHVMAWLATVAMWLANIGLAVTFIA